MVEALSYKIPVIAYNCKCGPKEIVKDGVNGYLIDFSVQELAQRILELTSDSEKLESFSSHCYDEIDRFDFKKIMNQWIEFYESVVKNMS
jgi:glycosyltransferase involved in cell wall biosynthesis